MSHKARSYFSHGGGDSDEENEDEVPSDSEASNNASDSDASEKGEDDVNNMIGEGEDEEIPVSEGEEDEEGEGEGDDDASVDNAGAAADDNQGSDEDERGDSDEEEEQDSDAEEVVKKKQSRPPSGLVNTDINAILDETVNDDGGGNDSDEENEENYLQKINADLKKSYILEHHPECIVQNYNEILALCTVVRDRWNNVVDPLHRTCPYLSKYERTRILGQRAKQINAGAPTFVKVPETIIDGYLIAEMELEQKKIPFIIRRPLPNGASEYWRIGDLENIAF